MQEGDLLASREEEIEKWASPSSVSDIYSFQRATRVLADMAQRQLAQYRHLAESISSAAKLLRAQADQHRCDIKGHGRKCATCSTELRIADYLEAILNAGSDDTNAPPR